MTGGFFFLIFIYYAVKIGIFPKNLLSEEEFSYTNPFRSCYEVYSYKTCFIFIATV